MITEAVLMTAAYQLGRQRALAKSNECSLGSQVVSAQAVMCPKASCNDIGPGIAAYLAARVWHCGGMLRNTSLQCCIVVELSLRLSVCTTAEFRGQHFGQWHGLSTRPNKAGRSVVALF